MSAVIACNLLVHLLPTFPIRSGGTSSCFVRLCDNLVSLGPISLSQDSASVEDSFHLGCFARPLHPSVLLNQPADAESCRGPAYLPECPSLYQCGYTPAIWLPCRRACCCFDALRRYHSLQRALNSANSPLKGATIRVAVPVHSLDRTTSFLPIVLRGERERAAAVC